ncbi:hypothetical protein PFISCL1PPCAC_8698 [Pristionchus fissidentatus]|uniref:Secreted protein n=1 Tax=Pristionchus fissidentatus TaxID=1538716 RepID=A0AAV5VCH4_9BILA|nr:hypothetical protein PFISCL1PPCAC_8698 [Pristionchus fissidentatus]
MSSTIIRRRNLHDICCLFCCFTTLRSAVMVMMVRIVAALVMRGIDIDVRRGVHVRGLVVSAAHVRHGGVVGRYVDNVNVGSGMTMGLDIGVNVTIGVAVTVHFVMRR